MLTYERFSRRTISRLISSDILINPSNSSFVKAISFLPVTLETWRTVVRDLPSELRALKIRIDLFIGPGSWRKGLGISRKTEEKIPWNESLSVLN
jgi:hypothetical protein